MRKEISANQRIRSGVRAINKDDGSSQYQSFVLCIDDSDTNDHQHPTLVEYIVTDEVVPRNDLTCPSHQTSPLKNNHTCKTFTLLRQVMLFAEAEKKEFYDSIGDAQEQIENDKAQNSEDRASVC